MSDFTVVQADPEDSVLVARIKAAIAVIDEVEVEPSSVTVKGRVVKDACEFLSRQFTEDLTPKPKLNGKYHGPHSTEGPHKLG